MNRAISWIFDYDYLGYSKDDREDTFCEYPVRGKQLDTYPDKVLSIAKTKKSYRDREEYEEFWNASEKSILQSRDSERAWASVGYVVLFGLFITFLGATLAFFVPDWWPMFVAAIGMIFVVIALWYGQKLAKL